MFTKKPIRMDGLFWCCGAGGGRWSGDSAAERLHRCGFLVEEVVDDVEQVDGGELLGGAEPGQTLDGGAVIARVAEVVTPSDEDWKTAAPQITDAVLNAKREQMFRGFLSLLRSNAKIELKNETILAD